MGKLLFLSVCLVTIFTNAQIINIPDANFKAKLLQADVTNDICGFVKVDANNDGEIDQSEALQVTVTINMPNANINDITGIEFFTNVVFYIGFGNNNITSINISSLIHLKEIDLSSNQLTSLTISGATALERLSCGFNQLTMLNFLGLPSLKALSCGGNQLTTIDFSNNPLFNELGCRNNTNLTSIIIKNGTQQNFTQSSIIYTDCWNIGNPNLNTICADANEVNALQNFLNNCGATQTINIVTNCALNNDAFAETNFTISPNPSPNGIFNINFGETIEKAKVEVYNTIGQKVYETTITNTNEKQLFLDNINSGMYLLKFTNGDEIIVKQIIK